MLSPHIFMNNIFQNEESNHLNDKTNYIEQIKKLYLKYIDNNNYLFTSVKTNLTGWIIILKRTEFSKTDETRNNVVSYQNAQFKGNNFIVELFFDQFDLHKVIDHINDNNIYYTKGNIIKNDVVFFKSIDSAFYYKLNIFNKLYEKYNIKKQYIWEENGSLKENSDMKCGKLHGNSLHYKNNKIIKSFNYNDGKKNGMCTCYYDNSNINTIEMYNNGMLHGLRTTYFPDDTLESEYKYVFNELHGTCKEFYQNGNLKLIATYKKNKLIESRKKYFLNGSVEYEESYDNEGIEHGTWKTYYSPEEGNKLKHEKYFNKGKKIGIWKSYFSNGDIKMILDYDNNKKQIFGELKQEEIYF